MRPLTLAAVTDRACQKVLPSRGCSRTLRTRGVSMLAMGKTPIIGAT
jgi:hypothetical protein